LQLIKCDLLYKVIVDTYDLIPSNNIKALRTEHSINTFYVTYLMKRKITTITQYNWFVVVVSLLLYLRFYLLYIF